MNGGETTAAVQRYLNLLADVPSDTTADPIVRELLACAVKRLHLLCAALLQRSYPRLTLPPTNLQSEELLGAVVERLLKALRAVRPGTVRQFFALANQHMRWELNDVARRLDDQTAALGLREELVPALESNGSVIGPVARRILEAIEGLPDEEREAFDLVRIQGLAQEEAACILGVSVRTLQRRMNRALLSLTHKLGDLRSQRAGQSK